MNVTNFLIPSAWASETLLVDFVDKAHYEKLSTNQSSHSKLSWWILLKYMHHGCIWVSIVNSKFLLPITPTPYFYSSNRAVGEIENIFLMLPKTGAGIFENYPKWPYSYGSIIQIEIIIFVTQWFKCDKWSRKYIECSNRYQESRYFFVAFRTFFLRS